MSFSFFAKQSLGHKGTIVMCILFNYPWNTLLQLFCCKTEGGVCVCLLLGIMCEKHIWFQGNNLNGLVEHFN